MTDEDLVKNLAWFREEAGLESAYPVTHPMSMFIRAIAARERLKKREWVGLTDDEIIEIRRKTFDAVATNYEVYRAIADKLKEKNNG